MPSAIAVEVTEEKKKRMEDFKKIAIAQTKLFRKQYEAEKKSALVQKIEPHLRIISSNASESTGNALAAILTLITGEDIRLNNEGVEFPHMAVVVVTGGRRELGHNYTLNEPVLVMYQNYGRRIADSSSQVGNGMPTTRQYVRPATDEEIESYFSRVSEI